MSAALYPCERAVLGVFRDLAERTGDAMDADLVHRVLRGRGKGYGPKAVAEAVDTLATLGYVNPVSDGFVVTSFGRVAYESASA